jgi:carbohydrate-selective porin OprB
MPAPGEPPEPTRGPALADNVQLGFAYQMHLGGQWQKVRLSHVSPGRSFFIFTHGSRHKQTVSLTQRMLERLAETGRLRAFENASLIDRATARARRQLAALRSSA